MVWAPQQPYEVARHLVWKKLLGIAQDLVSPDQDLQNARLAVPECHMLEDQIREHP